MNYNKHKILQRITFLLALSFIQFSFATLPYELIELEVDGAGACAAIIEPLLEEYPNAGLLLDNDGVVNNVSDPYYDQIVEPRGDMADYTNFLCLRKKGCVAISSGWPKPIETVRKLNDNDLTEALQLNGELLDYSAQFGQSTCDVVKIGKVASVRRTSFKEGMKNNVTLYLQKIFAFDAIYGPCKFEIVIVVEDSKRNLNLIKGTNDFVGDITETSFYPTLKKLILIKLPEINGEQRHEDKIDLKYLPQEYRRAPKEKKHNSSLAFYKSHSVEESSLTEEFSSQGSQQRSLTRSSDSCGQEESSEAQSQSGKKSLVSSH